MSENTRIAALASAVQLKLSPEATVAAAVQFEAFLSGTLAPVVVKGAPKPVGGKPAAKPAKSEDEVVKAALEKQQKEAADAEGGEDGSDENSEGAEQGDSDALPATEDGVKAGIARLLKANKRKEAIATLKKFGAGSASAVKPKDYAKFVAAVEALLGEGSESDDLTA